MSLQAWCLHPLEGEKLPEEVTMGRKLYVGNLPYSATEQTLRDAFAASGTVDSVSMITDRDTGQSKGFAFVEMATDQEAQAATQALNGSTLDGRQIKVNEARPKTAGGGGGRSGGGGYGGGGGGGRGPGGGGGGYGRRY
jgi:RNA recognition motif-containing protein